MEEDPDLGCRSLAKGLDLGKMEGMGKCLAGWSLELVQECRGPGQCKA